VCMRRLGRLSDIADFEAISSRLRRLDEDVRLLCWMNNLGITSVERAATPEEIGVKVGMEAAGVKALAQKLRVDGYLDEFRVGEQSRFYVTPRGILKVMATYT